MQVGELVYISLAREQQYQAQNLDMFLNQYYLFKHLRDNGKCHDTEENRMFFVDSPKRLKG